MKKYLIIGGAGFIGSHLCEALLKSGCKVAVIDDFSAKALKTIDHAITVYKANVDNTKSVDRIFKKEQPDVVFHLAGAINLRRPIGDRLFLESLNFLERTEIVLHVCKANNVKKIIFISSGGAVYENANIIPTKESYLAHPTSLYGLANIMIEKYIDRYCKANNLQYVTLRLSNVYGPRQWATGIVPSLITNLLDNKKPVIYGDGTQTRDFIYIDDVVLACSTVVGKSMQGIYNVGSGKEVSLNEAFELVKSIMNITSIKPIYRKSNNQESKRSALDISKIKKELGWKPEVTLEKGIEKTIEWFKNTKI